MFGIPGAASLPQTTMTNPAMGMQPISFTPQTGALPTIGAATGLRADFTGPLGDTADGADGVQGSRIGSAIAGSSVVRAMKAALKELGMYKGQVNSTMDDATKQSVLAFQKREGLKETGTANTPTRRALQQKIKAKAARADAAASKSAAKAPAKLTGNVTPGLAVIPGAQGAQGTAPMAGLMPNGMAGPQLTDNPGVAGPRGPIGIPGAGIAAGTTMPLGITGAPAQPTGPQMNATNQQGLTNNADGATQAVTNRNTTDTAARSFNESPYGVGGFGTGYGAGYQGGLVGWNTTPGGLPMYPGANPYTAPGASMTGAYYLNQGQGSGGVGGFFKRLLG